jgi:hypothetical protein
MIALQGSGEDETGQTYLRIMSLTLIEYDLINTSELLPTDPEDDADPDVPEQKMIWYGRWEVATK